MEVACSAPPDLGFFQNLYLQPVSFSLEENTSAQ